MKTAYRTRIYEAYVHARHTSLAPVTVEGLNARAPLLRQIIRRHFPTNPQAQILDLGCGHGAFIHFIREAGYHNVVGVDISPEQVAEAQRLGIDGVRHGDSLETLQGLPDASQDVVIAFDVIEHFSRDELVEFVDEVQRVLKPGGRWILHMPNGESPFAGRILFGDLTHEWAYTRTSIHQLLQASGFATVQCEEDAPIPHGLKSSIRWLLWKFIRGVLRFYLAVETGAGERSAIFSQNFLAVAVK